MSLSSLITDIGDGIGSFLPKLMKAFLDGFVSIFIEGTGESAKLSPVAIVAIMFIVLYACYKFVPMIIGWLKLSARKVRARRKARR